MIKFTDEQKKAIETINGIICLSAGPGCGKTFVLINRYLYILKNLLERYEIDVAVQKILAVTFTNRATDEMKERLKENLKGFEYRARYLNDNEIERIIVQARIFTIDAWANSFLKDNILSTNIKLNNDFEIIEETQAKKKFLELGLEKFDNLDYVGKFAKLNLKKNFKDLLKEIYKFIESLKAGLISPERFINITKKSLINLETDNLTFDAAEIIANLYEAFDNYMRSQNFVTFADLLGYTYKIFFEYPDILEEYVKDLDYILVDEYQDINDAQDLVLRKLSKAIKEKKIKECISKESKNNKENETLKKEKEKENYFIVGDTGQSIYSFRNANYKNMLDYKVYKAEVNLTLSKNFRSTKNIIEFTNQYFYFLERLESKNQKIYQKLIPEENKIDGEKIQFFLAENYEEDAEFIAESIAFLLKNKKYAPKDIKILFKTKTNYLLYARKFAIKKIPFVMFGGSEFLKRDEILFFLSIFRILANLEDDEANIILLTNEIFGFSLQELIIVKNFDISVNDSFTKKSIPIFKFLEKFLEKDIGKNDLSLISDIKEKIQKYLGFINKIIAFYFKNQANLAKIFDFILEQDIVKLYFRDFNKDKYLQNIEGIEKFKFLINQYEKEHFFVSINGFLQFFDELKESNFSVFENIVEINDYDAVCLMTIHASKGLEFPVVFLAGLKDNINKQNIFHFDREKGFIIKYSNKKQLEEREDFYKLFLEEKLKIDSEEEDERKLYVGITRSKESLYISCIAEKKSNHELKYPKFINKIFDKIDEHFIVNEKFSKFVELKPKLDSKNYDKTNKSFGMLEQIPIDKYIDNQSEIQSTKKKFFFDDYLKENKLKLELDKKKYFYSVSELSLFDKNPKEYFLRKKLNIDDIF
ncbi:MAG: ATP-dependent helicase [Elusimicrobiota bacterium]|jgi:DNA helicase-2/ATP-dependent DNA helicase PcrA|nr:ATP-dependent helicase [Elusimicrobiota bacterium]